MPSDTAMEDVDLLTEDAFLGGRVVLRQPRRGHRSGIDAVLLAAAVPLEPEQTVMDIGAGVGAAALCALARSPRAKALLVEADDGAAALARDNIGRNGYEGRADILLCDIANHGAAARAGVARSAEHAIANPPFYDPRDSRVAADKARAHAAPADSLDLWVRFAAAAVKPGGTFTLIHRPEALQLVLSAFGRRFGGIRILPLHPRPDRAAARILVQGTKGSRAPLAVLAGIVLHGVSGNAYSPAAEAVLRHGAPLPLASTRSSAHL